MALARKTLVMSVIAVIVLLVGIGGGLYAGLTFFKASAPSAEEQIPDPGPIIELGQFTSTLADPETHVVRLRVNVELAGTETELRLAGPGWYVMMKDEIMKTLKDQRFNNVRYAEGMEKLKQDLRARLNAILPRVDGKAAINRVLFDEYMVQ
jgi:flagellar FliL protein